MAWHRRLCLNPGRLRAGPYVYVPVFCATMCPRRITKTGCSVAWISLTTLPRTATISAALPGSSVPTSFSTPRSLADSCVPASRAAAGLIPRSTMSPNSVAFIPCGYTPASVPKAIGTPTRKAFLNIAPCAAAEAGGFAALLGAAADALDRPERVHALGREGVPVRVAARGADDVTGGQHARPFGDPGVDRVAQPDVDEVVGAHVAHGSEPCSERALCVQRGIQSLFGRETHHLVVDVVVIVPLEFIRKMRMGVDEAREKGRIAQIDDPRSGGRRPCPHRHDPVAPHDHSGAVLERRAV